MDYMAASSKPIIFVVNSVLPAQVVSPLALNLFTTSIRSRLKTKKNKNSKAKAKNP